MPVHKVLFIGKYFYPFRGGMEDHLYNLCYHLKDKIDFEILVHNTNNKNEIEDFYGKKLIRASVPFKLKTAPVSFSMRKYIKNFDGDILNLHEPNPLAALYCLLYGKKKKLVVTYHYDVVRQKTLFLFYRFIQKRILKKAIKIIATANNNIIYSPILSKFSDKCEVIALGIDTKKFEPTKDTLKEAESITKKYGEKIVLFVGRLSYYKGIKYLIEASKGEDYKLLVIGKGEQEEYLKKIAEGFDNIVFLKNIENVVPYYYASKLFVLPSVERSEAFGIVQMESMICERPVITTNLKTGVPEVQEHNKTGIIVEPGDADALNSAINSLLSDPDKLAQFGKAAKERVLKNYTVEVNAAKHLELYEKIGN